jgi:hypothetical protein
MRSATQRFALALFVVIFLFLPAISTHAACYSNTQTFDPDEGMFWNYIWNHTITDLPSGFNGTSATLEIKVQVWAWGNPARLDILCSDTTTFYAGNPDYLVGSLTPSTNPNPSRFYTLTFSLKPNQIQWLTNDKNIKFDIVSNGGTYYLDYGKLTVCGSVPITYTLTLQVNGKGTTIPGVGSHAYPAGTVVNLSAAPVKGWRFNNWSGDVANPDSTTTTVTVDTDKIVMANFKKVTLPPFMLHLGGRVT